MPFATDGQDFKGGFTLKNRIAPRDKRGKKSVLLFTRGMWYLRPLTTPMNGKKTWQKRAARELETQRRNDILACVMALARRGRRARHQMLQQNRVAQNPQAHPLRRILPHDRERQNPKIQTPRGRGPALAGRVKNKTTEK